MATDRYDYLDLMKGFAILLVIMGHNFAANTVEGAAHPAATIITSFHMAFFFFISGYVNAKTKQLERKGIRTYLLRKLETIMLPFFVWTLIVYLMSTHNFGLTDMLASLNFYPNCGYWFLPILFVFFLVYIAVCQLNVKWGGVVIALALCIVGLLVKQVFPIWYAVYWSAFMLGDRMSDERWHLMLTQKWVYGSAALLWCLIWVVYPIPRGGSITSLANVGLFAASSLLSCVVLYNFFTTVQLNKFVHTYLLEIGKYTLVLYLIPITFLNRWKWTFPTEWTATTIWTLIILISVIHSLVSLCIGKVIYQIPYLRYILFGKR